jgi:hypothetical protein
MSVVGPIAAKKLQGRECSEVPTTDIQAGFGLVDFA